MTQDLIGVELKIIAGYVTKYVLERFSRFGHITVEQSFLTFRSMKKSLVIPY